jgi:hypothetical protein
MVVGNEEASGSSDSHEPSHEGPTSSRGHEDDDGTVELVRRYLAEKLGFYKDDKEKEEIPKVRPTTLLKIKK